jgi:hypothetical protein
MTWIEEETMRSRSFVPARRWITATAIAALAAIVGPTVPAGAAGHAASAKQCKKKGGVSAGRRCRKQPKLLARTAPGARPQIRAILSWTGPVQLDLHAFDAAGNQSGLTTGGHDVTDGIPNTTHSGDVGPGGASETFTDDSFSSDPGAVNREFSYIVCVYGDEGQAYFTGINRERQFAWANVPLDVNGGESFVLTPSGGPATPAPGSVCV